MTRGLILAAIAAIGLSGCDQVQHYADLAVAVAPVVNSTVQSYAVLNDATLSAIADANRSDPKLQAAIANIRKGNAITATSANVIATYAPAAGVLVDAGALVGKTIGAQIKTK